LESSKIFFAPDSCSGVNDLLEPVAPAAVAGDEEPEEGWACEEGLEEEEEEAREEEEDEDGTSPRAYCSAFAFNASTPAGNERDEEDGKPLHTDLEEDRVSRIFQRIWRLFDSFHSERTLWLNLDISQPLLYSQYPNNTSARCLLKIRYLHCSEDVKGERNKSTETCGSSRVDRF
jgi:hypothetical protein